MNTPGAKDFALNPADHGVPTREELRKLRIWDMHYHGQPVSSGIQAARLAGTAAGSVVLTGHGSSVMD